MHQHRDLSNCIYYSLSILPPQDYLQSSQQELDSLSYRVEAWFHQDGNRRYRDYTCSTAIGEDDHTGNMNLPVEAYVEERVDYFVYIRAAVVYGGVVSEYRYFRTDRGECRIPVLLGESSSACIAMY